MTGKDEFTARLARIQAGQGNRLGTLHIGSQEEAMPRRALPAQTSRPREIAGNLLYPLSLVGAMAVGGLAVALGRYARFHLFHPGAGDLTPDIELAINMGLGMVVSFILGQALRLTSKEHRTLQGAGVFMMIGLFHNLGHWLPAQTALIFSPAYAAELATTPPNSFYFRGAYFPLFDRHAPAETALAAATCTDAPKARMVQTDHAKGHGTPGAKRISLVDQDKTCAE